MHHLDNQYDSQSTVSIQNTQLTSCSRKNYQNIIANSTYMLHSIIHPSRYWAPQIYLSLLIYVKTSSLSFCKSNIRHWYTLAAAGGEILADIYIYIGSTLLQFCTPIRSVLLLSYSIGVPVQSTRSVLSSPKPFNTIHVTNSAPAIPVYAVYSLNVRSVLVLSAKQLARYTRRLHYDYEFSNVGIQSVGRCIGMNGNGRRCVFELEMRWQRH